MAGKIEDLRWRNVEWPAVAVGTRIRIMAGHLMGFTAIVTADNGQSVTFKLEHNGVEDAMGKRWLNDIST